MFLLELNMSRLRHRELIEFAWFGCWTTSYLKRMEQGSNMRCKTFLGPTCSNAALHTLGSTEAFTTTNKQYIAFYANSKPCMHFALRTAASDKAAAAYAVVQVGLQISAPMLAVRSCLKGNTNRHWPSSTSKLADHVQPPTITGRRCSMKADGLLGGQLAVGTHVQVSERALPGGRRHTCAWQGAWLHSAAHGWCCRLGAR